jgi:hypothetical protein
MLGRLAKTAIIASKSKKRRKPSKSKDKRRAPPNEASATDVKPKRRHQRNHTSTPALGGRASSTTISRRRRKRDDSSRATKGTTHSLKTRPSHSIENDYTTNNAVPDAGVEPRDDDYTTTAATTLFTTTSKRSRRHSGHVVASSTMSSATTFKHTTSSSTSALDAISFVTKITRPWHGAIDTKEQWYLNKLSEPRNKRADITRMIESRPAEFDNINDIDRPQHSTSNDASLSSSSSLSTNIDDLLTYSESEKKTYTALWGHLNQSDIRTSVQQVTAVKQQLQELLLRQSILIEHLNQVLNDRSRESVLKYDALHERLNDLDRMIIEKKKYSMEMLERYKDNQKMYMSNYEEEFQSKLSSNLEKAVIVRDDKITTPSLKYVQQRMVETQKQHDKAMRDGIVVRGFILIGIVVLRMVLLLASGVRGGKWLCRCCRDGGGALDSLDSLEARVTRNLEGHLLTLEEFRMGGSNVKE